jgi:hypothetical protein
MKKIAVIAAVAAVVVIAAVYILFPGGPDPKQFEYLKEPKISSKPGQNMLIVESKGDPNTAGAAAFGQLFKAFFKLKRTGEGFEMAAPLARWPGPSTAPKDEWIGIYGMRVPESIREIPEDLRKDVPDAKIARWEYGEAAEILHIGPYGTEAPTIQRLHGFITKSGYEIAGPHEEEYLKGPGMFLKGNPDKYLTIIRYPVRKK